MGLHEGFTAQRYFVEPSHSQATIGCIYFPPANRCPFAHPKAETGGRRVMYVT